MTDCRFCDIIEGTLDAQIVYADDLAIAFLDHAPLTRGHCLVVPRMHFAHSLEVPPSILSATFLRVQTVSRAMMTALKADGVLVVANTIVQQTVPHFHVHVVPRWLDDELSGFNSPGANIEEVKRVAHEIRAALHRS